MGKSDKKRLRFAFVAGDEEWSGFVASSFCSLPIDLVGALVDTGAAKAAQKKKSSSTKAAKKLSTISKLRMHVGLAARLPEEYWPRVKRKLTGIVGRKVESQYQALRTLKRKDRASVAKLVRLDARHLSDADTVFPTLEEVTSAFSGEFYRVDNLNSERSLELLRKMQPDVVIGLGTRILKSPILELPEIGVLNGHSSLLPEYRGGNSEFWQLAGGETITGVTIHWMVEALDGGPIVTQHQWDIPPGYNHHQLRKLSLFNRKQAWSEAISRVVDGVPGTPQTKPQTPVFRFPTLEQKYRYYCKGENLLD